MTKMTPTPLTYDSIIPVGTLLRCIGGSTLKEGQVYVVTSQDCVDVKMETRWVHLEGCSTGYNPRIFEIVPPPEPQELWTL